MRPLESIWTTLPACVLAAAATRADSAPRDLGARDPARIARALEAERGAGAAAAARALDGFEAADVVGRRLRARVLRTEGGAAEWPRVLALALDPDPGVRVEIAHAIGRPDRAGESTEERVDALARLADLDPDADVRAAARAGLATLGAVEALTDLADRAPRGERGSLLGSLAARPDGRAAAAQRLSDTDEELVGAARLAAEGADAATEDAVLARIAAGLARGSTTSVVALDRYARRLVQLGDAARALAALKQFEHPVAYELRARLALSRANDPAAALEAAAALASAVPAGESVFDSVLRRSRAARYELCARTAIGAADSAADGAAVGEDEAARESVGEPAARVAESDAQRADLDASDAQHPEWRALDARRAELDALIARRADRGGPAAAVEHAALLEECAQIELCHAVQWLARDEAPRAERAVDAAFALHAALLRAQAVATRAEFATDDGLDPLLSSDDSAVDLLLDGEPVGVFDVPRQLAIRVALGRALRTAAGGEVPGFEPLEEFARDARVSLRNELLQSVLRAELQRSQDRYARASFSVERARTTRPGGASAALRQEELEARILLQGAWEDLAKIDDGDSSPLLDVRSASWFAVTTSRRLREAGRGPEAREILSRARADLDASGAAQRWLWGIEYVAEIEAATGASFTDDEEPARAEIELLRAVDRLQALEDLLRERGAPPRALDAVRNQRASALVSLAVNANVRMHEPERALKHFEAAWAIRQDEFSRALLACYRARSGRAAEARAVLATVAPGPGTYYNLACTWALLGDREAALHWLEMELTENHAPGGSLERQQAWARKDPDLESLRGDARFVELVGK